MVVAWPSGFRANEKVAHDGKNAHVVAISPDTAREGLIPILYEESHGIHHVPGESLTKIWMS